MGEVEEKFGEISYGFLTSFFKETGSGIRKFFVKNHVGFLPEGMDYSDYQKIKNDSVFTQLKFLIGDHETLSIILAGLYISSLCKELRIKIVKENRNRIYEKYGIIGVSILNMAVTGFIHQYVKWLASYNIEKNPSKQELVDKYEEILREWIERTLFVQNYMPVNLVYDKIKSKLVLDKEAFFVFASGNAIKIMKEAMEIIKKDRVLMENRYSCSINLLNNNEEEIVWSFQKIK